MLTPRFLTNASNDNGRNLVEYASIRYGGSYMNWCSGQSMVAAVALCSSSPTLNHVTISESNSYGLKGWLSGGLLKNSTIQNTTI